VPPYFILSNDTLAELAARRPTTREQLLTVKGIGPAKGERYGHALLEIIAAVGVKGEEGRGKGDESGIRSPKTEDRGPRTKDPNRESQIPNQQISRPSSYWTQRLLAAGFTVDECAAIRGLTREIVLEHARRAERDAD
jgi:ATP-dependent DNA helicase RecQ